MIFRGQRRPLAQWAALLALVVGCGRQSGTDPRVSGTVLLDKSPLEAGTVLFQPEDPGVAPQMAEIKAGSFELHTKPGKYRVVIEASRQVPNKSGKYGEPIYESMIPARYQRNTILRADVAATGSNTQTFELESD